MENSLDQARQDIAALLELDALNPGNLSQSEKELVEEIRRRSGEVISIGEGVVYPVLHGLERSGALASRRQTVNGRSRVYYTLTPQGAARLDGLSESWTRLADAIRGMIGGPAHA